MSEWYFLGITEIVENYTTKKNNWKLGVSKNKKI